MKIFKGAEPESWSNKVNFVDENNVMVGYEMSQCCCEHPDWFILYAPLETFQYNESKNIDVDGYVFDTNYFKEISEGDGGGIAIFRLVNGDKELYLHLYNSHNGYYSHGFDMKRGEKTLRHGVI